MIESVKWTVTEVPLVNRNYALIMDRKKVQNSPTKTFMPFSQEIVTQMIKLSNIQLK